MTYTYALMEVSEATFNEIKQKLEEAGYDHAIHRAYDPDHAEPRTALDMHGIGLVLKSPEGREELRLGKT